MESEVLAIDELLSDKVKQAIKEMLIAQATLIDLTIKKIKSFYRQVRARMNLLMKLLNYFRINSTASQAWPQLLYYPLTRSFNVEK